MSLVGYYPQEQLDQLAKKYGQLIRVGRANYSKQVAVIYNPNSGKKRDVRADIIRTLNQKQIPYQIYETKGYMDAWKIAQTISADDTSAFIAVGGDGTLHEVVNGMMFRSDKRRIPIAFVPNGSGNDTCKSLGIQSIDQALEYIQKGDLVKIDLNRIHIDSDSFDEIEKQEGDIKFQRIRYSLINSGMSFLAKCVHTAISVKKWAGQGCYFVAALTEFFRGSQNDAYRISVFNEINGKLVQTYERDVASLFVMVNNGRYGGGGNPITPAAIMNDGLFDIALYNDNMQVTKFPSVISKVMVEQGTHVYDGTSWSQIRGKQVVVKNLNYIPDSMENLDNPNPKKLQQLFQVDGEGMVFTDKVTIEVVPEAIEIIMDFDQLMHQTGLMCAKLPTKECEKQF